jgi:hypothetical protein
MLTDALKTLSETPPRCFNVGRCNKLIHSLEIRLGLPAGKDFFRIGLANARLRELSAKLAAAAAPATKAPTAPLAKSVAANPGPTAPAEIAPATLAALCLAIYGTDAETSFEGQRQQLTRSGLAVPGLAPAPENPNYTVKFVGFARAVRAERQSKVSAFFNPKH